MDNGASSYRRYLDGDDSAFDEIVKELFDSLVFFIGRYVADVHTAEDIAIDAFTELIVHKGRFDFRVSLKTYLFMIGRSRALNYIKRRKRIAMEPLSEAEQLRDQQTLEELVLTDERKRAVNSALEKLPEEMRLADARIAHRRKVKKQVLGIGIPMLCLAVCASVFFINGRAMLVAPYQDDPSQNTDAPAFAAPTEGTEASFYDEAALADLPAAHEPAGRFEMGDEESEYLGVTVNVNTIMEDYDFLETVWINESDLEVEATDAYDIEYWEESRNAWVSCMMEQPDWSGEPFAVPAGQTFDLHSYEHLLKFDLSRPGAYRFTTDFYVSGDAHLYTLWSYFRVLNEEEMYPTEGCVIGCPGDPAVPATPTEPEQTVIAVDEMGAFGSDYPGVYLEYSDIYLEEGYIQAFWRNETATPARIYEGYDVAYLDGDTWVSCKKEYPQFGEDVYELDPWPSLLDVAYPISSEQFDLSRPGEYRLTAQFWVEGDDTLYTAWAWFTLAQVVVN